MKNQIYGFEVTNVAGQGFRRWFNSDTVRICNTTDGNLPGELERVCSAQCFMTFNKAYSYTRIRSKALFFDFKTLTEEDFKKTGSPIKEFFKRFKLKF